MLALVLVWFFASSPPPRSADAATPVLYLIAEPTPVRAEPSSKSRTLAKLQRFEIVSGREHVKGWLLIEAATRAEASAGWVPLVPENVVPGPLDAVKLRVFRVQHTKWPDRVKLDVIRGRVREGYNGIQVQLAIGDPLKKELLPVGGDVVEAWIYPERRVVFSHTGVQRIEGVDPSLTDAQTDR